ncbi:DUF1178 family protein [Roseovarius mucosus]|uniref:DUF1178 family protein n=1 Tax=Roseovarius mucosus TaxID=215743 RepID=UPI0035D05887|tara:strand:+ start:443 stop:967 length:525 start_codon:yes stop_codon:yes gene_type:complete
MRRVPGWPPALGLQDQKHSLKFPAGGVTIDGDAMDREMIKFTLRCADKHEFDSWFQSAAAFDKLQGAGMVTCAVCGGTEVQKALMAPSLHTAPDKAPAPPPTPEEQALAQLKRQIEQNSEYVGLNFAREAREMHDGLAPERAIYGEAKPEEARKLIEDGVPVAPLPFVPRRKSN